MSDNKLTLWRLLSDDALEERLLSVGVEPGEASWLVANRKTEMADMAIEYGLNGEWL